MAADIPQPDSVTAQGDPGDDTARRFVYQWTYAAIMACAMLDETLDVAEIFCEHHEDVLVKHTDGAFTGHQVKTRDVGGDPWKATDEAIFGACCKFIRLEHQFPGCFRAFVLATNHTFLSNKTTGSCFPYLLQQARAAADEASADGALKIFLRKLCKSNGHAESTCLAALKKCRHDDTFPKIDHIKQGLINALAESWGRASDIAVSVLALAADALIAECQRASSLDHAQSLPLYLTSAQQPRDAATAAAIAGKRLNRQRFEIILRELLASPSLLVGPIQLNQVIAQSPRRKLDLKLEAGGFSPVSINSAKDLRDKAEYKSLEWVNQLGDIEGLKRHDHIRSVVLRDCAEAYETAKSGSGLFGLPMRAALRAQFQQRRASGGATLFDCLDEHLEGHAYSLTNECRVWWSQSFALPEEP